jgi:hypothetical protein
LVDRRIKQNKNKMKINSNYKLRSIAGETIVVNQGTTGTDMTRIISLNASAKLLYEQLLGKEFTLEDAAKVLVDTYGIGSEQALADAEKWADALRKCGVIE